MKGLKIIILIVLMATTLNSCKDDHSCWDGKNLLLKINGTIANANFLVDTTFVTEDNHSLNFLESKFYLSNISLIKDDFTEVDVTDVLLHDFAIPETHDYTIPAGTYRSVKLGIGLSPELNSQDPSTFERDHPLSFFQDTYWGWSSQYKFLMFEGTVEKDGIEKAFSYHTGTDTLYRTVEIPKIFTVYSDRRSQLDLNIDFDIIFQNINMVQENFSHTDPDDFNISYKITQGFRAAIE